MFVTLRELLKELRTQDHGQRKCYQLYVIVTRSNGVDFQSCSLTYRVTDETSEEAVLILRLTDTSNYPHIGVGDVVRLDRCVAQFREGTIECRVFKPEKIVVFPRNDPNNLNPKSAAENPTFYPSDVTKVAALRALNIGTVGELYSFSNVCDNGREMDVVAQLVGFQELNDQRGLFAFFWDGTRCPVRNLIHFKRFYLDSPENPKAMDKYLLLRSKGFLHHLFLFDNIAGYVSTLEPGSFVLMEGVRVAYKKISKELYLTCKGNVKLLNPNDRNVAKLKDRLSKVPLPPPGTKVVAPGEEDDDDDRLSDTANGNQASKKRFLKSRHNASRVEIIDLTSDTEDSGSKIRREISTMINKQGIPKITRQRTNLSNGSMVSFQVENENPLDNPQPSTSTASNNQRDVSTCVNFFEKYMKNHSENVVSNSPTKSPRQSGSFEDVTSNVVLQVRVASSKEGQSKESEDNDAFNSLASGTSMQLRPGSQFGELRASAFDSSIIEESEISQSMETESN